MHRVLLNLSLSKHLLLCLRLGLSNLLSSEQRRLLCCLLLLVSEHLGLLLSLDLLEVSQLLRSELYLLISAHLGSGVKTI